MCLCIFAGCKIFGFSCVDLITVVKEDNGISVAQEADFLSLPMNTKFMLLGENESWFPPLSSKEGFFFLFLSLDHMAKFLDLICLTVPFRHSG